MKASLLFASAASFLAVVSGCGSSNDSPFGSDPDFASYEAHIAHPDGTMNGSVFSRYADATSAAKPVSSGSGTTKTQALHALDDSFSFTTGCAAFKAGNTTGTCGCPEGGQLEYDFSDLASKKTSYTARVRFEACRYSGYAIDGKEFVHLDTGGPEISGTVVANLKFDKGAESHTFDMAAHIQGSTLEIALSVDDGWITVKVENGQYTIRDRNGTWTCVSSASGQVCTSPTGETKTFSN